MKIILFPLFFMKKIEYTLFLFFFMQIVYRNMELPQGFSIFVTQNKFNINVIRMKKEYPYRCSRPIQPEHNGTRRKTRRGLRFHDSERKSDYFNQEPKPFEHLLEFLNSPDSLNQNCYV